MKEKINKILWDFAQGKLTHDEATQQVLDLFAVSDSTLPTDTEIKTEAKKHAEWDDGIKEFKQWLEQQIERCLNDKDLQREHWAFCKTYEKFTALQQTPTERSAYCVHIAGQGETCVIAKNINEAMDKIEKLTAANYKFIFNRSLPCII